MSDIEINEACARKLFTDCICLVPEVHVKDYCNDIKAAWEIVEKHNISLIKTDQGHWYAIPNFGLSELSPDEWYFSACENGLGTLADTAPMAICLAFLKLP